jgi:tripartite-type tricarboxylate transporter receptor subunit TctC
VRIVVGFSAGSAADIVARITAQELSTRLEQPFVVENRGGAGGSLAAEAIGRAIPDGYTLLLTGSQDAVNATVHKKDDFDLIRDLAPVSSIAHGPLVLVVNPSFPAATIPEFIAFAKSNPGKVSFGSAGIGSVAQMAGELFKVEAGVDMVHVPYRGLAPALTDLIAGRLQAVFATMPPAIAYVRSDRLRALAVTSAARFEALPDLPTIGDFLPGYEASISLGLGGPKGLPEEIIQKLNKGTNAALADPLFKARLTELGMVPSPMTPQQFGRFRAAETEKWRRLVRNARIGHG